MSEPSPQPTLDSRESFPPLKPGVDKGVYSYLRRKLGEVDRIRSLPNGAAEVRGWRSDLLYNLANYYGTKSPQFEQINVFRAIEPRAFVSQEREERMFQQRHAANMDRIRDALGSLLREMESDPAG